MQLFISHSSEDGERAVAVQDALRRLGFESTFLDIDAVGGLRAGDQWRDVLFENVSTARALVLVGTERAATSRWVHTELALARFLRIPVVPLAFDGTAPHEVVTDVHAVPVPHGADGSDLAELLRPSMQALGLQTSTAWDPARSPYPGLRPFREDEAAVFVGRDASIDELRRLVDPPSRRAHGIVVPVLGPSGSGKSSLVRAGFVPRLRTDPSWLVVPPIVPRESPTDELAVAMHRIAHDLDVDVPVAECRRHLLEPRGLADFRRRLAAAGTIPADVRMLIVIDQGEELVTVTSPERSAEFLEALAANCEAPSDLVVVITARTDLWDRIDRVTLRRFTSATVLHVPAFSRSDLVRIIEEPAARSRIDFEAGLVERLVDDTGTGHALPFLAFVLGKMVADAERRGGRLLLTHAGYDATGGVQGGIALQARAVADAGRHEAGIAASVLPLVTLTGPDASARRVRADELTDTQRSDLDRLAAARLIVIEGDGDDRMYAASHDALLSAWAPLAELIETRQDDLRLRDRLARQANDWVDGGRGRSGLLDGAALDLASGWTGRSPDLVTPRIAEFVDASRRQSRRTRWLRRSAAAVVAGLAAALIAVLVVNARAADRRATEARAGELIAIGEQSAVSDPVRAAHALITAYDVLADSPGLDPAARSLLASSPRDAWDNPDGAGVLALATGGDMVAAIGISGGRVWRLSTGELMKEVETAVDVAVRADGRLLAAVRPEGIDLIDLATEAPDDGPVASLPGARPAFSPDGTLLAARGADVTSVTLWDVADPSAPRQRLAWRAGGPDVHALAFDDDGDRLLTVSGDGALRTWDLDGNLTREVSGVVGPSPTAAANPVVGHVSAVPDTDLVLVSGVGFGKVGKVVDVSTGEVIRQVGPEVPDELGAFATLIPTWSSTFDRQGSSFVAFDISNAGQIVDVESGEKLADLRGHSGLVMRAFVTDDGSVVSAGLDGSIRVWQLRPDRAPAASPSELRGRLCVEFGARLAAREPAAELVEDGDVATCADTADASEQPPALALSTEPLARRLAPTRDALESHDFDAADEQWPQGDDDLDGGRFEYGTANGIYRAALDLDVDDWFYRSTISAPELGVVYRIGAVVDRRDGDGGCGLSLVSEGEPATQLYARVDPSSSMVLIDAFLPDEGDQLHAPLTAAPAPIGDTTVLELHVDHDVATVIVDGTDVASVRVPETLGSPTQIGIVTHGGRVECAFDDLHVATG